jgi:flagellar hook-associated protein 1 FlgK
MSLTASMGAALAGLSLNSKRAETVAANVANVDRPGYARRTVESGSRGPGLAPDISTIDRAGDSRLSALRREADARAGNASVLQSFHTAIDNAIGDPDQPEALQGRIARFDSALLLAAANPYSDAALSDVAHAAADVAAKLTELDGVVADRRQAAEDGIGKAVAALNSDLSEVARLNADIRRHGRSDQVSAGLLDRRDALIDRISEQVPVHVLPRDGNTVALVTHGGSILLDSLPVEIGFTSRSPITASMAFPGALSGLTIGGHPVSDHGEAGSIGGGRLSALFEIRDHAAPDSTTRLDVFATELVTRFSSTDTDPTLASGEAGLFELAPSGPGADGAAARVRLNATLDPNDAATFVHLRSGFGTVPPSPADQPSLSRLSDAVSRMVVPSDSTLGARANDLSGYAAGLRSIVSADRVRIDGIASSASAMAKDRTAMRDGAAVDIDAEMRRLVDIEQSYAANARVLQVAGEMLDRLTEI